MRKLLSHSNLLVWLLSLTCISVVKAQTPFHDITYIDVNNIRAAASLHGDLWHSWTPTGPDAGCEFPKGSGKHIAFAGSLWMAGFDKAQQLRGAATTYRSAGQEYWPGPLQGSDTAITYVESEKWARIWKISRSDIQAFLAQTAHTVNNTPRDILEWPAKGNINAVGRNLAALTITDDMAPFVDVDNNGVYNALQGDYPALKGDQMLWFVFNDNGPVAHNEITFTPATGIEIKAMVYGYNNGSLLNNVLFYEYELRNTQQDLDSFIVGTFADMDLGYAHDDYIGFDSSRNMGYTYNGDPIDGTGLPTEYGDSLPIAGIRFLEFPGNSCSTKNAMGSFMYFNSNTSNIAQGAPTNGSEMYNYLKHTWRDSTPLRTWSSGRVIFDNGYGGFGKPVKYVYNSDPHTSAWNECTTLHPGGDRRFVMGAEPIQFLKGSTMKLSFALVAADRAKNNGCPFVKITSLQEISDSAQSAFCNPQIQGISDEFSVPGQLSFFPNPFGDKLQVDQAGLDGATLILYSMSGQKIDLPQHLNGSTLSMETASLRPGTYMLVLQTRNGRKSGLVVKQ